VWHCIEQNGQVIMTARAHLQVVLTTTLVSISFALLTQNFSFISVKAQKEPEDCRVRTDDAFK